MNKLYYDTHSVIVPWEIHPINNNPLGYYIKLENFGQINLDMKDLIQILEYV